MISVSSTECKKINNKYINIAEQKTLELRRQIRIFVDKLSDSFTETRMMTHTSIVCREFSHSDRNKE